MESGSAILYRIRDRDVLLMWDQESQFATVLGEGLRILLTKTGITEEKIFVVATWFWLNGEKITLSTG